MAFFVVFFSLANQPVRSSEVNAQLARSFARVRIRSAHVLSRQALSGADIDVDGCKLCSSSALDALCGLLTDLLLDNAQ
jgi:hypothetical protein